jgi:hypothetical protein
MDTTTMISLIGVIIMAITLILYIYKITRKSLSFNDKIVTPIFFKESELRDKIKILFNNNEIKDVYLAIIKIFNSGNVDISSSDFETPITIDFGEKSNVLSSEVIDKMDNSLDVQTELKKGKIDIKPLLLNNKDWFKLRILISDYQGGRPKVYGRIKGVKQITYSDEKYNLMKWLLFIGVGIFLFAAVYTAWSIFSGYAKEHTDTAMNNAMIISFIGFIILMIPVMWLDIKGRLGEN